MEWDKKDSIGQAGFTRLRLISTVKLFRGVKDHLDKRAFGQKVSRRRRKKSCKSYLKKEIIRSNPSNAQCPSMGKIIELRCNRNYKGVNFVFLWPIFGLFRLKPFQKDEVNQILVSIQALPMS